MAIIPIQLARVSTLLQTSVATQNIQRAQQQLLDAQQQLSTGRRLNSLSDNPGDAAIAQQLRKALEQRQAYQANLTRAGSQLGVVDSTLGDLTALLQEAQSIASANVGSDVTPDQRQSAAALVKSLYNQVLSIGNKQLDGVYLFAGDRSTASPFAESGGGVKFVGSGDVLQNQFDENTVLPFMVSGDEVFGALSTRVQGTADLTPSLSTSTRLVDLNGAMGEGVRRGSILVGNGTTSATVDLSDADSIDDVIKRINNAGVGGVTASIGADGVSLTLSGTAGDNITVQELGGYTARDLGIHQPTGAGAGVPLSGESVQLKLTLLTPLANLKAGAGIDTANGMIITNGQQSATIDLSGATTVEDLINAINGSGTGVLAGINATATGLNLLNPTQGLEMRIAENGGTTAADLGVRSFGPDSPLIELNGGRGVQTVAGADFTITDSNGVVATVDLGAEQTIQDVLDTINTAAGAAGAGIVASFATTGNGIVLTDTAGGAGTIAVTPQNFSTAARDLGLDQPPSGSTVTGADVNPVTSTGVFANLLKLHDAMVASDQRGITAAAEGLKADYDRIVQVRAQAGARVQEIESRQDRLADENIVTQALLSQLEDVDFTEAIARFQTLQTSLEASLKSAGAVMNLSLLDFLK